MDMVVDSSNTIVYMDSDTAETYGAEQKGRRHQVANIPDIQVDPVEIDDELGLEIVQKKTIFQKYGVHCDPNKNSFYASLHRQFEKNGSLSEKQVNALRK